MPKTHCRAILLIGPTGSGKTPLGAICEEMGLWKSKCFHFDFGAILRKTAETTGYHPLTSDDRAVILHSLKTGALLENETFYIAERIFRAFVEEKNISGNDFLILNGLPRHLDQARDVDRLVDITRVVYLSCSPIAIHRRISLDSGGDRLGRKDDSLKEVKKKIEIFQNRTLPLLDYYRNKNLPVHIIEVGVGTRPQEIHRYLERNATELVKDFLKMEKI